MFPIKDHQPSGQFPAITALIILANVLVFIAQLTAFDPEAFIYQYALIPASVDFSNFATLTPFLSSIFLHAGFVHIGSNMWFLAIFGDNIEAALGRIKYLFFYLTCGAAAGLVQFLFISNETIPMLGASGAVAGVLGAYWRFFPRHKIDTIVPIFGFPTIIALPASFMLIYWFFTQLFAGVATIAAGTAVIGGVAFWAHAGGFVAGILLSPILIKIWRF